MVAENERIDERIALIKTQFSHEVITVKKVTALSQW